MLSRYLVILILLLGIALLTNAQSSPDYDATATELILDATRNAQSLEGESPVFETPAEYQLTATILVANVTETALASGVETVVPATEFIFVNDADFALTATAMIQIATAQAGGTVPIDEVSALPATFLLFLAVILGLLTLASIFIFLTRREEKQK